MPSLVSLVRLVLPRRCVACRRPGEWMCDECGPQMRPLALPQCARCGAPTAIGVAACRACAHLRFIATARSALWLDGPLRVLVARWKRGEISPGELAAALVVHEVPRPQVDAIAVVPAVRERLLLRGADPPAEIAAGLARWWGVPVVPLLARTRGVRPQRGLDAAARRGNVRGAFEARAGPPRLALVDDVYTTGATADECARALRGAGAAEVHVVTLARTPLDRSFARGPPRGRLERNDVPERGGTRCNFRSAVETWKSRSPSASTRLASWRASSAT
jgi:predicted amidophosphoribosyltransferase